MCVVIHVSARYSRHIIMKLKISRQILEMYPNIKFHENPFNESRDVPWGWAYRRKEGRTDGRTEGET